MNFRLLADTDFKESLTSSAESSSDSAEKKDGEETGDKLEKSKADLQATEDLFNGEEGTYLLRAQFREPESRIVK